MEFRVLQYFLTIAREESISGAAEFLHITQPTLSRQLKELEEELGKELIIRGNRKITLTEDGMLLRKRAEEIIQLVEKTEAELNADDTEFSGDIYVGGAESEGMRLIARAIARAQSEHPLLKFHLFSGNAEDVSDRLDKGLIDFGVLVEPTNMSKYDFTKLPTKNVWGILMRKDSPLATRESITSKDLRGKALICSNQLLVKNELAGWLGGNERSLNIVTTYNLLYNASLLVEEGERYALCLDGIIATGEDRALCFRPLEPKLEAGLHFVWKKYQVFSKASEYFLGLVQEEARAQTRQ
ncbi:LysR family transcriptional regulator [Trichococcus ilyis]|uniref:DNA-binding transcriptional regulator, LysR family n=1 Tax=Trichococcus ilyis TaxID=640938 RepID=A0A143YHC8_9LACT|nr:LysR family transcriptional regulator [Trichococcus ilyis]CZQ90776.1 transcription regulator hth lysr [Trichococcus ilyis]SEI71861.1 DNA-binding transcriptional regulator, LysR family [Trichococcus ilyis]